MYFCQLKDPFGERRGCFNYESIDKRLDEIKKRLDEKQVTSSDSSDDSEMETNEKTSNSTEDNTGGVTGVKDSEEVKGIS